MSKRDVEQLYKDELAITQPSEIDIDAIAYFKGATVKYRALKGCEARIIGHGDKAIISVNSNSFPERKRFSVGHELGHWFKHRGSIGNLCKNESVLTNRSSLAKSVLGKEKIANEYASELLMPGYLFTEHISGSEISFDVIMSIKESFRVSLSAAAIRYINFCDYPALVASYNAKGRRWYHKSKFVPDYFYPVRTINKLSPGYQNTLSTYKYSNPHEVDADMWIDINKSEEYEVMEVVWKVSKSEIMVFIWWKNIDQIDDFEELEEAIEIVKPRF